MHLLRYPLSEIEDRKGVGVAGSNTPSVLVIGVGNEMRGDDAVGLIVARRLRMKLAGEAVIVEEDGDGPRLVERWKGFNETILVDAVRSGAEPGQIHRFEADKSQLPTRIFQCSTHAFNIPQAIELARAMNQLPFKLTIFGIEGKCFDQGDRTSPTVEHAARKLVKLLALEILQNRPLIT
jgi:hydrogenase maturation protease